MPDREGLQTAFDEIHDRDEEPGEGEPEQQVFPALKDPAPILGMLEEGQDGKTAAKLATRGPGRRKGSKNKRTQEWADYLAKRGNASPMEFLASVYNRPVEVLAAECDIELGEALRMQISAATVSAPYWHGKRTPDAATGGQQMMVVPIMVGGQNSIPVLDGFQQVEPASPDMIEAVRQAQLSWQDAEEIVEEKQGDDE